MGKSGELKTKKNNASVAAFLNSVADEEKRKDAKALDKIFREITKEKPKMWGTSIIGYGEYHYKSDRSTQEGDWMRTGFSPRKQALTLYIMPGYSFPDQKALLTKLGSHKTGKSCLYIKRLSDVHLPTLKKIIKKGWDDMSKRYPRS